MRSCMIWRKLGKKPILGTTICRLSTNRQPCKVMTIIFVGSLSPWFHALRPSHRLPVVLDLCSDHGLHQRDQPAILIRHQGGCVLLSAAGRTRPGAIAALLGTTALPAAR